METQISKEKKNMVEDLDLEDGYKEHIWTMQSTARGVWWSYNVIVRKSEKTSADSLFHFTPETCAFILPDPNIPNIAHARPKLELWFCAKSDWSFLERNQSSPKK